ncbi:MAG: cytochrome c biogenesis protein CcdA [Acidobacteriota bacterium]|nr:cytochrome c biogenesis protein CcdA [Acidobacteriota bacterium]
MSWTTWNVWWRQSTLATIVATVATTGYAQPPQVTIHPVAETDAVHAGSSARLGLEVTLEPGYHVNSNTPLDDLLIPTILTLDPPGGFALAGVAFPDSILVGLEGQVEPLAVFEEEFVIGAELRVDASVAPGVYALPATLRYQACNDRMCFNPTNAPIQFDITVAPDSQSLTTVRADLFAGLTMADAATDPIPAPTADTIPVLDDVSVMTALDDFDMLGSTGGYLDTEAFLGFKESAESGEGGQGWFEGRGPLAILALILVGGLALNLTPCVLPMIPINLAIIGAGAKAESRMRGFALGGTYGLAMALVYGVLGLIVILTAGTFGTINSSPWFNLGIAALFVVLGLAMFDVLAIDFSRLQSKFTTGSNQAGSFVVAFGMGAVAALLAGACVAPVVIQVIVFSSNLYGTGTTVALALPFFLGIGMALPWPVAGAGLSLMPKPGAWMVHVKHAFGVFILGTAIYYGYLSYGLFAQRWVDPTEVADSVQELLEEGWHASLGQGLAAAQAENKLVLVDMWATWCKNCLTMDRTTLKAPAVEAGLEDYVKVKFQAEDLDASPAREVLKHLEGIGLPTYAILRPRPNARQADVGVR